MSDEKAPTAEPDGGRVKRATVAAGKLIGMTSLGGVGGVVGAWIATSQDKTGQSTIECIRIGVWLGGLSGLTKILADGPVKWVQDYLASEARAALIEANRKLAWCEAEKTDMRRRMDAVVADVRTLTERLDAKDKAHEDQRASDQARYERLDEKYVGLLGKVGLLDKGLPR